VRPLRALLLAAPLVASVAACGGGGDEVDAGAPVTDITITSTKTEFDVEAFAIPAGTEVSVTYANQHGGVPHNLHLQIEAAGDPKTETKPGPDEQTLTFTAPEAGEFDYICDVHPGQMKGTVVVVEEGGNG
jgi:plastocyanin